jgi:hypothetical protein
MLKQKKKFICVRPISEKAEEMFEYTMLGLQSCEVLNKDGNLYQLKPIRANFTFWLDSKNDENWEIEK